MTKRSGSIENNLCKKPRIEQKDDWDDSEIDDCLILATQICEQSVNNISKLPTYGEFEKSSVTKNIYCSTQIQQIASNFQNIEESEQLRTFKEKCEAKEGEVTILRQQLKVIKTNLESEFSKKKEELNDKIDISTQKINALKSDLEFRDLEIANLKQKIIEISRANRLELSFSLTQIQHEQTRQVDKNTTTEKYFEPINSTAVTSALLHDIVNFRNFGYLGKENYFLKNTSDSFKLYLIPHLNDSTYKDLTDFEALNLDDKKLRFSKLSKEIYIYLSSPERELNLEKNLRVITTIIALSYFFLESLNSFLEGICKNIETKDVRQIDNLYLENKLPCNFQKFSLLDAEPIFEDEIGISARQSIALIALILRFNDHIRKHILESKHIDTECLEKTLKLNTDKCLEKENYFLSQLVHIIKIIGKTRKAHVYSGLILAVVDLLTSISITDNLNRVNQIVIDISKEIVFSRPNLFILEKISSFFVRATTNIEFVDKLCQKANGKTLRGPQKDGITYFDSSACLLQIYCILIETSLKNSNDTHLNLYSNIIKTLSNILESNSSWTFYQENEHNDCLSAISRLFIDLTHNFLQTIKIGLFSKSRHCSAANCYRYIDVLKMSLKIIHILNFHSASDIIVKYVGSYSQYKYVINTLYSLRRELQFSEFEIEMLQSLQSSEDDCSTLSNSFCNISLWNEN